MDANEVKALRDQMGVGMQEAKRILQGRDLLARTDKAKTVVDLKPILELIIKTLYPYPQRGRG
ncbi:hypothetical protein [Microvirga massiliensis]|uniref:hypothetical protein n=1 Tax=Microvirga massiliensis TaxID=1033741 RepID=UPI00062BEB0A|nr:hypothetical protein [Microvirga massiliensis]